MRRTITELRASSNTRAYLIHSAWLEMLVLIEVDAEEAIEHVLVRALLAGQVLIVVAVPLLERHVPRLHRRRGRRYRRRATRSMTYEQIADDGGRGVDDPRQAVDGPELLAGFEIVAGQLQRPGDDHLLLAGRSAQRSPSTTIGVA